MNRLSAVIRANAEALLQDVHDTFARDIIVWKKAKEIVISTNPKHNFMFQSSPNNTKVEHIPVSGLFKARVLYGDSQKKNPISSPGREGEDQIGLTMPQGTVRLKIDNSGYNFVKDATRITLDGSVFEIDSDPRPHGLFEPKFTTIYLKLTR